MVEASDKLNEHLSACVRVGGVLDVDEVPAVAELLHLADVVAAAAAVAVAEVAVVAVGGAADAVVAAVGGGAVRVEQALTAVVVEGVVGALRVRLADLGAWRLRETERESCCCCGCRCCYC